MARRSRAREIVLQLLYQHDHNKQVEPETARQFLSARLRDEKLEKFGMQLYLGTIEYRTAIDAKLSQVAENWSVERMAAVDRNILRLGAYELIQQPDTPHKVIIDESVELAKRFGSAESPSFVNGILDRLAAGRGGAKEPA